MSGSRVAMQLVGMLDSPYVRRVAVSLQLLGLAYEHRSISVFRQFDAFAAINPVVKAPSLVCDDGTVLMDSTLILEHVEAIAPAGRSLVPRDAEDRLRDLRVVGLALAACEKAVQAVYERTLRPADTQHAPWLDRVGGQMRVALALLEAEASRRPLARDVETMTQGALTVAVVWRFAGALESVRLDPAPYPALAAHGAACEALPAFRAAPHD